MNVCRICLCDESKAFDRFLVDIFQQGKDNHKFSVPAALQSICGIELSESDTGPNRVCLECRSRLEEAFNLRRLALRSHETLAARSSNLAVEVPEETSTDMQWMEVEPLQNDADDVASDNLSYAEEKDVAEEDTEEAPPGVLLICCGCDFTFADEWSLMEHSREVHYPGVSFNPPRSKVLCRICYALFVSEKILAVHWSGKTGGRVLRICPRCGDRFWCKESYEGHVCSGQEEEVFRCCGCDFQTVEESKFKWHARCHRIAERKTRDEEWVKACPFFCSVCAGRFETREELAKHRALGLDGTGTVKVGDLVDLKLTCCGCLKVYKTVEEVKAHQEQVHAPEREAASKDVYECGDCFKRFYYKSTLKNHTNTRRNYRCSKCPAMRHSVQNMLQHLDSHDGPKSYWCCGCRLHRERFDTPEELARHSQEIHANQPRFYRNVDNVEEELPFQCKTCFRRYSSEKRLRAHMVVTYAEESFVCDTCGKPFSRIAAFETHMATHRETSDYPCPICSKKFKHHKLARICELRHLKAATVEYDCKICGGKFSTSSNLNSHLISHTEATRFSCSICGMRFKRKTGLRVHMVLHGSERKFACPYCPSRFHMANTLDKHMIHHTGIYPYECEFSGCGKKFQARLKYIEHFEIHMDDAARVFSCHMCEQRYSRDHFLANHLKYVHRIEPQDRGWRGKFNRQRQPWVRPAGRPAALAGEVEDGDDDDEELNEAVEYIQQDIE